MLSIIKPTELVTEDDAWNYVIWYDITVKGRTPLQIRSNQVEKEEFYSWWLRYRTLKGREKELETDRFGRDKILDWHYVLKERFNEAQKYRDNEALQVKKTL